MSFNLEGDKSEVGFSLTLDKGRRSGDDRRRLLFAIFAADRRSGKDRRNVFDKRITKTKYFKNPQGSK